MKKAIGIWAAVFGIFIAAAVAQTPTPTPAPEPGSDPAYVSWAEKYAEAPFAMHVKFNEVLDASAATAAQKWALAKERDRLLVEKGQRGLQEMWAAMSAPVKAAMRAANKELRGMKRDALKAADAVEVQKIADADATPVPTPTPEATPQP